MRPRLAPAFLCLLLLACQSEETNQCHAIMGSAQETVKGVDAKDLASVERSLASVEAAMAACTKANRTSEVDALTKAKNELSGHAEYLRKRAAEPKRKKMTAEQLADIAAHGDPNCPKGQAYRPDPNGKEIRCTGPQISDMSLTKAEEYFRNRGYKLTKTDSPPTLKAEYGAELYVFTYAAPGDAAPRCLTLYPAPGLPYQEAVGRATGVMMKKIEKGSTVATDRGPLALRVDEGQEKLIVYLGDCP